MTLLIDKFIENKSFYGIFYLILLEYLVLVYEWYTCDTKTKVVETKSYLLIKL